MDNKELLNRNTTNDPTLIIRRQNAVKMKQEGFASYFIAKVCDLSEEEVRELPLEKIYKGPKKLNN